jgi:DnaJ-class molecular chaperone
METYPTRATCPTCKGSGVYSHTCAKCKGTGEILTHDEDGNEIAVTCWQCDGAGIDDTCPTCGGTGEVAG